MPGLKEVSTQIEILAACTISQDRRINYFTTGAASPGIKCPDKIVVLFGIHSAFTFGTFHVNLLGGCQTTDESRRICVFIYRRSIFMRYAKA
jgi:hypothetical protein